MKEWKEYLIKVNGFEMKAVYNEETIREVFLPLLKHLHELQKQKNERLIVSVLWQHHQRLGRRH